MHDHPASVAVFLNAQKAKFTYPDGRSEEQDRKRGDVNWEAPTKHLPENLGDKPLEVILVELKGGAPQSK